MSENRIRRLVIVIPVLVALSISGCSRGREPRPGPISAELVVYGFSALENAMTKEILPAFRLHWKAKTGGDLRITSYFAGSGTLTSEILTGAPADVAVMANEMDALKLRQAGLSSTYWRTFSHQGVVAYSPMVILVRRGNPRNIQDFGDLTIRGTKVIQSDPRRSGAGLWGVLAVHEGYLRGHHGDKRGAYYQLSGVWENTVSTPASAEEALRLFDTGFGDALITYEQEGLGAQDRGSSLEIVYPGNTVYAQHPVVIVDRNVSPEEKDLAREFVLFLWAENVQRSLVRHHFRAVTNEAYNAANSRFKPIAHPFTADSLGGWEKAYQDVAVKVWEQQVMRNSGK